MAELDYCVIGAYDPTPAVVPDPPNLAPVVALLSPTDMATIEPTDPIVIYVTDITPELKKVYVWARLTGLGTVLIYDGDAFTAEFSTSEAVATPTSLGLTLRHDAGWPANIEALVVKAFDTQGKLDGEV